MKLKETWLATDEDGPKHIFGTKPKLNTNIFGEHFWYAPLMVEVNNIKDFLPHQSYKDEPRLVKIKISWK